MNAPIFQILWLHRRLFLGVMSLTFLVLAIGIVVLPKPRIIIRSSIEIGTAVINGKEDALEPPDLVTKRIPGVYAPATVLEMAKKGTSPSVLATLQNSSVDNVGRTLVVISTVDASAENEAKEFQEAIADQIIKDEAPRVQSAREAAAVRIASLTRTRDSLEQEIKTDIAEIERIGALTDELRGQIKGQRAALTMMYQRAGTAQQPDERSTTEAQIRELFEQVSSQTRLMGTLTIERILLTRDLPSKRRQHEAQTKALADEQLGQKMFNQTRVSLAPSLMPVAANSRLVSLLLVAFTISILIAFGTVVLLHNFVERRLEH